MADVTSGTDRSLRVIREPLHFGTIVVVGGGCYGGYYVRQMERARRAGAATWTSLVVVDQDESCRVARLPHDERPPALQLAVERWVDFFARYLADAAGRSDVLADAIVPSPLMPHLLADWLVARARARWPERHVAVAPLASPPDVPWQRAAGDSHYVSFAEWMCPINCVEPARCPATRGPRDWSMPVAIAGYANREAEAGRAFGGALVLHCTHRTHGVGMIDVLDIVRADAAIGEGAAARPAEFLVGTASHCHGALQRIVVGT